MLVDNGLIHSPVENVTYAFIISPVSYVCTVSRRLCSDSFFGLANSNDKQSLTVQNTTISNESKEQWIQLNALP